MGEIGRNCTPRRSVVDCVESSGNPEKSPLIADPPPARFFGEGAISMEIIFRSSEIRLNRHLPGTNGRDFVPHGSVGDCVESSESREKVADSRTRHPAGSPPMGEIQGKPARPTAIERNKHLLGADGRDSVHRRSAVRRVESSGNPENPIALRSRHLAAHSEKRRCLRKFAEAHPMLSECPSTRRSADHSPPPMAFRGGKEAFRWTVPEFPIIRPK